MTSLLRDAAERKDNPSLVLPERGLQIISGRILCKPSPIGRKWLKQSRRKS
jgi:hypothetical protein